MNRSILKKIFLTSLILLIGIVMLHGHAMADKKSMQAAGVVNINKASVKELAALSGIGKTKAEAIIAYRSEHGTFERIDEIQKIKGIGKKIFENIRNNITAR